jgi:predicted CopG family antitoxin
MDCLQKVHVTDLVLMASPLNGALAVWVDKFRTPCIHLCMATKTLSVDEEAYLRLVRAKQDRRESFSAVIKRARWDRGKKRCGDLLARASGHVPAEVLDALDRAQAEDLPPDDPWNR